MVVAVWQVREAQQASRGWLVQPLSSGLLECWSLESAGRQSSEARLQPELKAP